MRIRRQTLERSCILCFCLIPVALFAGLFGWSFSSQERKLSSKETEERKLKRLAWGGCEEREGQGWCDQKLDSRERTDLIVEKMTWKEKANYLCNNQAAAEGVKIPGYNWWNEALHGLARSYKGTSATPSFVKATVFPQPIGLSSSFNLSLIRMIGERIGVEARVLNRELLGDIYQGMTLWAPNLNIFLDPRWGRGQETPGEDPLLNGLYGTEFVKGVQGENPDRLKASACAKHMMVYNYEGRGMNNPEYADMYRLHRQVNVSHRDVMDTFLPPFRDAVEKGKVSCVMCSYSAISNFQSSFNKTNPYVPACAMGKLLRKDRRTGEDGELTKWGFDGYVTTDCGVTGSPNMKLWQGNEGRAMEEVLGAGVDSDCSYPYNKCRLSELENTNNDTVKGWVDEAVRNLVRVQMRLGFFDKEEEAADLSSVFRESDILNKEAARQSTVLLKKSRVLEGKSTILEKGEKLYASGRLLNSTWNMLGNYASRGEEEPSSIFEEMKGRWNKVVPVQEGTCGDEKNATHLLVMGLVTDSGNTSGITPPTPWSVDSVQVTNTLPLDEMEALDRVDLLLPHNQTTHLLSTMECSTSHVVLVLMSGSPIDYTKGLSPSQLERLTVIWMGYGGQYGSSALAESLQDEKGPVGRLTTQWYHNDCYLESVTGSRYDWNRRESTLRLRPQKEVWPGMTYRFYSNSSCVLHRFGHGLSLSKVEASGLSVKKERSSYHVSFSRLVSPLPVLIFSKVESKEGEGGFPQKTLVAFGHSSSIRFSSSRLDLVYPDLSSGPAPENRTSVCVDLGSDVDETCFPLSELQ